MLPTVDFLGKQLTRLILGDNPFTGNSYIEDYISGDEMLDYYTAGKVVETLFEAEKNGINTYMALGDPFILRCIRQYRNEGGKMHVLFQSYPPVDLETNLWQMLKCEPIGIYHQGGTLDMYLENGEDELVKKRINLIKSSGVPAGIGTHSPNVVRRAQVEEWGLDFYVTCLYDARRQKRGETSGFISGKKKTHLVFFPEDPPVMMEVIRKTEKPCIAFKVLAGGQRLMGLPPEKIPAEVERAFEETYAGIKPGDLACIGVYQGYKNQLSENCATVKRILER